MRADNLKTYKIVNRIYEWRKVRGLSQQELAARMNTTQIQISRLETSARDISSKWLGLLANVLQVPPGRLIGFDSEPCDKCNSAGLTE